MRPALALAVAVMLVLAGCSGVEDPTTSATATTTPETSTQTPTTATGTTAATTTSSVTTTPPSTADDTDGDAGDDAPALGIDVMNGPLPFDPNVTYARVQAMLGTNQSPPGAVMVIPGMDAAGSASNTGRVFLDAKDEAVLAHEFAHSILLRAHPEPAVSSPDASFASKALVEGAAEYTEAAYTRQYLDEPPTYFRSLPEEPGRAYYLGRYYFGYRYFDARADDVGDVPALHEPPANTSEQVMHGLAPSAEPPRDLVVSVADRNLASNATWQYAGNDRLGEITAFLTLRTRLDADAAAAGADGWGNDRLVSFAGDGDRGFVWTLRWDDEANATEFVGAAREFRNASAPVRGPPADDQYTPNRAFTDHVWTDSGASIDVRRIGPETVVVAVGPESFVEAAAVSQANGTVSVGVDG